MNKSEAIDELKSLRESAVPWQVPHLLEAIDMAIEALKEQEISKELQEYAYECGYEHFFHECQNCEHRRTGNKPNYETDTEVRLAVTNRNKDKVVLWDAFGEVEYYPCDTRETDADRPHGEWVEVVERTEQYDREGVKTWATLYQCSNCGFVLNAIEGHIGQYNFCPNCGCAMDMRKENK